MNASRRAFGLSALLSFAVFSSALCRAQDTPDIPGSEENASGKVNSGHAVTIDLGTSGGAPASLTDMEKPDVQPESLSGETKTYRAGGNKKNRKKKINIDTENPYEDTSAAKGKIHIDEENPYEDTSEAKKKFHIDEENPYDEQGTSHSDTSSLGKRKGSDVGETQSIDDELNLKKDEKKRETKARRR